MARKSKKQSTESVVDVSSNASQTISNEETVNPVATEANKAKEVYKAPSKTLQLSNFSYTSVSNNILL